MAAYAVTVTSLTPTVRKLNGGMGMLVGSADITNYNQANTEITAITSKFRTAPSVVLGGLSSNGYLVSWNPVAKSIKAWKPGAITDGDVSVLGGAAGTALGITADSNAGALTKTAATTRVIPQATFGIAASTQAAACTEAASDVNVGIVQFAAFGISP